MVCITLCWMSPVIWGVVFHMWCIILYGCSVYMVCSIYMVCVMLFGVSWFIRGVVCYMGRIISYGGVLFYMGCSMLYVVYYVICGVVFYTGCISVYGV